MGVQAAAVQAVEKAVETFGGIDIVVNNAAILRDAFVFKGNADDWDAVIRNNLSGPYYLVSAASKAMRDQAARPAAATDLMGPPTTYRVDRRFYRKLRTGAPRRRQGRMISLMRIAALDMALPG